jgi:hypothetical protein
MVLLGTVPASRLTCVVGDDVRLEMELHIIDAASAQSACISWQIHSVVRLVVYGMIIMLKGVLLLS